MRTGSTAAQMPDLTRTTEPCPISISSMPRARRTVSRKIIAVVRERIPEGVRTGSHPRCPGAMPDEPRRSGRSRAEHRVAEGAQPAGRGARRTLWLDLLPRRQGHAGRERLRSRGLQRRSWHCQADRSGGRRARRHLRRQRGHATASASSTSWCWPMPRPSTRARVRNTRQW